MKRREEVIEQIEALAASRINDAVRLAFLTEEEMGLLDRLDLSAVTELKRNSNGTVELKFLDRLKALPAPVLLVSHEPAVLARADAVIELDGPPLRRLEG